MHAPGRHTVLFTISGPIRRDDLPGLCNRVGRLLPETGIARCDVEGVEPDAVCVDALARLQLAARRRGCCVRLEHASDALLELVALMGLTHVLPADRDPPPFCPDERADGAVDS
jgi:ABC-type transporter Mla MlaB component